MMNLELTTRWFVDFSHTCLQGQTRHVSLIEYKDFCVLISALPSIAIPAIYQQYGEIWSISPYLVRMWENTDQKNSVFGHFSSSASFSYVLDFTLLSTISSRKQSSGWVFYSMISNRSLYNWCISEKTKIYELMCAYQGVRNVRFLENLACFVFLLPPFWDSPFCLLPTVSSKGFFIMVLCHLCLIVEGPGVPVIRGS